MTQTPLPSPSITARHRTRGLLPPEGFRATPRGCETDRPVIGMDVSPTKIGYGLIRDSMCRAWRFDNKVSGDLRLASLYSEVREVLRRESPGLVVLEGYSFGSMVSRAHAAGEAGGVVRLALLSVGVPYVIATPSQVKKFVTGKGVGKKELVLLHMFKAFGLEFDDNDECDGMALALIGSAVLQSRLSGGRLDLPVLNSSARREVVKNLLPAASSLAIV